MQATTNLERDSRRWWNFVLWLVPLAGVLLALATSAILATWLLGPPLSDVVLMELELGAYSISSILVVFLIYWVTWTYIGSLNGKLLLTTLLGGLATLFNGWMAARLMFVNQEHVIVAAIMLLFATIIGVTFGAFGFSQIGRSLRQMAGVAQQVAGGDLNRRAQVSGRDEVAQLGAAFNAMIDHLQAAAREREEVEKLRRDLIAWVSHDLRTPLTSIRAMTEALHDGLVEDPATIQRYYRTMRADIIGLNRLIDDLFELAQLDAGRLTFEMAPASLRDLVSDSLESFRILAEQRHISLSGEVRHDVDTVLINAEKMGRVLANLISNALKYTPAGGQVSVLAERHPDGVAVTVQDSGPGFNAVDLPRVFEKFYRGEGARSRTMGNSAGLGLAIARGVVEAHGGYIWAYNAPEGGACVRFVLPLYPTPSH